MTTTTSSKPTFTLKGFFYSPTIVDSVNVDFIDKKSFSVIKDQPFIKTYTIRLAKWGAQVYDNGTMIARMDYMNSVIVDPTYRKQGIATNMIIALYNFIGNFTPMWQPTRTTVGQKSWKAAGNQLKI